MPTFFDLPKPVRETIYRLHLVRYGSITYSDFKISSALVITNEHRWITKRIPDLLHANERLDREAAGIYFGENHFDMTCIGDLFGFLSSLPTRHCRKIRCLTVRWIGQGYGCSEVFRQIGRLRNLQQLRLHVDEAAWLHDEIRKRPNLRWREGLGLSSQLNLLVLYHAGMNGLRDLLHIPDLQFLKMKSTVGEDPHAGGALDGGCLKTLVQHEINVPTRRRKGKFRFLDLPGEIRTTIYTLLLCSAGVMYPTNRLPTTVLTKAINTRVEDREELPRPDSALSVLAVNRLIHDEAVGIFYWDNDFVFSWPAEMQSFMVSLGAHRLSFIRSISLFHKDHKEGSTHTMDVTLSMIRLLPNLKKLHILLEAELISERHGEPTHPGRVAGSKTLFSLRGIQDIKIRDLCLEERLAEEEVPSYRREAHKKWKKQAEVLRHFNHGLALAQQGHVVHDLYRQTWWHMPWSKGGAYPKLGDQVCTDEGGCKCPGGQE